MLPFTVLERASWSLGIKKTVILISVYLSIQAFFFRGKGFVSFVCRALSIPFVC